MMEILNFIFSQFSNLITFLDSFVIYEQLTVLRVFIILALVNIAFKFLFPHKGSDN